MILNGLRHCSSAGFMAQQKLCCLILYAVSPDGVLQLKAKEFVYCLYYHVTNYKVIFKPEPAHDTRAVGNDIEYLSPKFSTCGSQIQLAIWPIEKTSEDFNGLMDASIEACRDGTFTMR